MSVTILPEKAIDISFPIFQGMATYPGDPKVEFEAFMQMETGAPVNLTCLHLGSHTGTHYDAPHHILNNGVTLDDFPLSYFYGPTQVIALDNEVHQIDAAILSGLPLANTQRILFKTRNSLTSERFSQTFKTDYVALTPDGAAYLSQFPILLVGIDGPSIEQFGATSLDAHKTLMQKNMLLLEGLCLHGVAGGRYTLSAFPLPLHHADGAPTRAILFPE